MTERLGNTLRLVATQAERTVACHARQTRLAPPRQVKLDGKFKPTANGPGPHCRHTASRLHPAAALHHPPTAAFAPTTQVREAECRAARSARRAAAPQLSRGLTRTAAATTQLAAAALQGTAFCLPPPPLTATTQVGRGFLSQGEQPACTADLLHARVPYTALAVKEAGKQDDISAPEHTHTPAHKLPMPLCAQAGGAHRPLQRQEEEQEQQPAGAQQPLWQRFVKSRRAVAAVGAAGLGAGAVLALWGGGLLAVPALHLVGLGVAGAKAGTVAAAAAVQTSLAAPAVLAACSGAVGGGGAAAAAASPLLMSNAVLSAAGGNLVVGGASAAASMALMCMRGLLPWQQQEGQEGEEAPPPGPAAGGGQGGGGDGDGGGGD